MNDAQTPFARVRESLKVRIALTENCHAYVTHYNADGSIKRLALYLPGQASWQRLERHQATLDWETQGIWRDEDRPF